MATNIVFEPGYQLAVVCDSPAAPDSGDPVRIGKLTGLALLNEGEGGASPTQTVVNTGPMVVDVLVDDNEGTAIANGDPIYYHDIATGGSNLNNSPAGADAFFGIALAAILANGSEIIRVFHFPVGLTGTMSGSVGAAQLGDEAVDEGALSPALAGEADGLGSLRVARFTFDPSANAGERTIGAHLVGEEIPDNALILGGITEILTTFASAGADAGTIAASVEGANDLITATAISSGTFWDAVKTKAVVPDALNIAGIATAIKLTAARQVTFTVGGQVLTAGKLVGWLFYVVGA